MKKTVFMLSCKVLEMHIAGFASTSSIKCLESQAVLLHENFVSYKS